MKVCLIFCFVLLFLSSCSLFKPSYTTISDSGLSDSPPLSMEVVQAFFDGEYLKVKVYLTAKTDLNSKDVVVVVSGLSEGETQEQQTKVLADFLNKKEILEEGENAALEFSLKKENLTEYQVKCAWGEDAKKELAHVKEIKQHLPEDNLATSSSSSASVLPLVNSEQTDTNSRSLELVENNVCSLPVSLLNIKYDKTETQCLKPPCDIIWTVSGKVENNSSYTVRNIELAVGLYWASEEGMANVPTCKEPLTANEQKLSLDGLTLASSEGKKFRVSIDRPVPIVKGGGFIPNIRLLNAEVIK